MTAPQASIRSKLQEILATREFDIPQGSPFGGTGAPGLYLERLLGLNTSNLDMPDAGRWEVKFTSGSALMTLFHKEADTDGPSMRDIIAAWGYTGKNGRPNFRRTICGQSDNYIVSDTEDTIRVSRTGDDSIEPFWSHDSLVNAFASKLRNLIHVQGTWNRRTRRVAYHSAEFLSQARTTQLIRLITDGTICIDFDAYLRESGAVRNHGTKFRIKASDLHSLYTTREAVG